MPTPDFVLRMREKIGHDPLWLLGATAVILRDDEVLLVRRSDNGIWAPVAGVTDPGEHPAVTAVRESLEEACVEVEIERLVQVSVSPHLEYPNGDQARYCDLTFRCRWVSGEAAVGDDESLEVRWFSVAELPELRPHLAERIRAAVANRPECELFVDGVPLPIALPTGDVEA